MAERGPLDDCVHCGFCLPACPTWISWGEEMDSPRGRIDLMRGVRDGRLELDAEVALHLDRCLGCMGCVTACPSGVRYDRILEEARQQRERAVPRRWSDRLVRGLLFAFLPYPARLRIAAALLLAYRRSGLQRAIRGVGLLRRLSARLSALDALVPAIDGRSLRPRLPPLVAASGPRRARVGLVTGCVQGVFFPGVNEASARVLAAEGCEVVIPPGQGCCGALSAHAGRIDEARRLALALVERFEAEGVDLVVINSVGCGSHLKDAARLFAGDPGLERRVAAFAARVRDVNELVAALPPRAVRRPLAARIAYHSPCHLAHAQGVGQAPRTLLRGIPGLELVEIAGGEQCCGSAGIYNLVQPASAALIGARKADAVQATGAAWLASANPGCTLHLQRLLRERGAPIRAAQPIEFLDASLRGEAEPGG